MHAGRRRPRACFDRGEDLDAERLGGKLRGIAVRAPRRGARDRGGLVVGAVNATANAAAAALAAAVTQRRSTARQASVDRRPVADPSDRALSSANRFD